MTIAQAKRRKKGKKKAVDTTPVIGEEPVKWYAFSTPIEWHSYVNEGETRLTEGPEHVLLTGSQIFKPEKTVLQRDSPYGDKEKIRFLGAKDTMRGKVAKLEHTVGGKAIKIELKEGQTQSFLGGVSLTLRKVHDDGRVTIDIARPGAKKAAKKRKKRTAPKWDIEVGETAARPRKKSEPPQWDL